MTERKTKKDTPVTDLRVLDVKKPKSNYISVNDMLWSHPAFILIISPPASGKSALLVSIYYRWFKNVFDTVYWCSPTLKMDNTLALNVAKDETIIRIDNADDLEQVDNIIRNIIETQDEALKSGEELEDILIVLDDCISFINSKMIAKLATMYRHLRITVIVSIQKMKMLSTTLRACASDIISFAIPNKKQRDTFFEEFSIYPDIETYYELATNAKYNWLRMDLRNMALYHGSPNGIVKLYQK